MEEREVCTRHFGQQKAAAFWNGRKVYPLQLRFLVPEKAEAGWKTKKPTVHRPVILKRCKNSVTYLSSDNATALILSSTNLSEHSLTPQRIPIFPIQVCIYTAFIHISDLFQRYIFDLFLICRYLLPILLLIADRLFFLVILCRRNASRMPLSLHPNASAISDWYASGWAATYAFSFSGSIFRKLLCRFFFSQFPVSFSCFSIFVSSIWKP